ncbi:S49 family peptidase [Sphingobium lignivorans]|nr:S49 family peptidase [Sphingobium lignivorans]
MNPFAALVENGPVLVDAEHKAWFSACLHNAAQTPRLDELMADQGDGFWYASDDWRAPYRPYVVKEGILHIPVKGILLNNFGWQMGNWATGYDYIWRAFERGLDDPEVKGIALMVHSPGGLVAGNQVLVDKMSERRGEKPLRGFAQESACSAAYNIIAVAPHVNVSPTGTVGSIGVYTMHLDWSAANDRFGVKVTYISAGEGKVDGNPDEPLSERALSRMQARVDDLYSIFVASVSRNRSELTEEAIRKDLGAFTYSAAEAVSNGLADSIGSHDDALSAFAGSLDDPSNQDEGEREMSTPDNSAVDQAAHEKAIADAATTAAAAMQARIGGILQHEEAKGREELANHFAFATDMSVEAAAAALATAPRKVEAPQAQQTQAEATNHLDAAMSNIDQPNIDAGGSGNDRQANPDDASADLALAKQFGLRGFVQA